MVRLAYGLLDTPGVRLRRSAQDGAIGPFAKVFERWGRLRNPGGYLRHGGRERRAQRVGRRREVRRRVACRPATTAAPVSEQDYLQWTPSERYARPGT